MFLERYYPEFFDAVRKRTMFFTLVLLTGFLFLVFRLWYLQVMKGEYFSTLAENNRVRTISLPPYRGTIFDRNNNVLVNVRPSFNLYLVPEDSKEIDAILSFLKSKVDINIKRIKKKISSSLAFQHILLKRNIRRDTVAFIEEHNFDLPGVIVKVEPLRSYRNKDLAAHTLGYISEINKKELEKLNDDDYKLGDFIGKYGVEKLYENELHGKKGFKYIEVDSAGRELNLLEMKNPKPGNSLILTLDQALQKKAERLFNKTRLSGSVVMLLVDSGEILAMVSKPSFDPNLFANGISSNNWTRLLRDERHPLQNRAIQGQYPPASTYKIITAAAGLEEKIITPETTFSCTGRLKHGRRSYRCWKKAGHGTLSVKGALIQSCDIFFYKLGLKLGIDTIAEYAKKLGLGVKTGIALKGEKNGLIPTKRWKEANRGEVWLSGETVSASVGQGYNLVTPLQLANVIAAIANGGSLWKPTIVKRVENSEGEVIDRFMPELIRKDVISSETIDIIRSALYGVVNSARGTAWRARNKEITIAGKTGTAQVIRMKEIEEEEEDIPLKFKDHAWFVGFAPYENPEVAVSVIVEHGGHGGRTAAPIVRDLIMEYNRRYSNGQRNVNSEE